MSWVSMMRNLIIERPEIQTFSRKYGYALLTLVFWTIYLYLWLPLISLLAWVIGIDYFYEQMLLAGGYQGLIDSVRNYILVVVCLSIIFICWARINLYRFDNIHRRRPKAAMTTAMQAEYYKLDELDVVVWQSSKHLLIEHDEQGMPVIAEDFEHSVRVYRKNNRSTLTYQGSEMDTEHP